MFGRPWMPGLVAGTDSVGLFPVYLLTGLAVIAAAAYRYWVTRRSRPLPSFSEVIAR